MKTCVQCIESFKPIRKSQFCCSIKCYGLFTRTQTLNDWLAGKIPGHKGKVKNVKPFVRDYLLKKFNGACSKCGWNTPHPISNIPPLEVNHIDGNADYTFEPNLELLCPNCHSLTLNYKNRNKGNGCRTR